MNQIVKIRSPREWADYITAASLNELDAILEKGKRITELHNAYLANPKWFGGSWIDTCINYAHLSQSMCSRYEQVFLTFIGQEEKLTEIISVKALPADIHSLDYLARAAKAYVPTLQLLISKNVISPDMSRDDAKRVYEQAEKELEEYVLDRMEKGATDFELLEETGIYDRKLQSLRKKYIEVIKEKEEIEKDNGPDVAMLVVNPPKPAPYIAPSTPTNFVEVKPVITETIKRQTMSVTITESPYSRLYKEYTRLAKEYGRENLMGALEMFLQDTESV